MLMWPMGSYFVGRPLSMTLEREVKKTIAVSRLAESGARSKTGQLWTRVVDAAAPKRKLGLAQGE
jgi:hypothetical protein